MALRRRTISQTSLQQSSLQHCTFQVMQQVSPDVDSSLHTCGDGAPRRQWQLGESTKHTMAASGSSVKAQHHKHKLSSCTGSSVQAPSTPQTQAKLITYRSTSKFCGHPQEADTSTQQGLSFLLLLPRLSQELFAMR